MSRLLLRTVLIIFLGVFAADAVSMRIVRSGEITEEVALTDLFKGGLALAQQRMNASTNVAATERILADLFEAPVSTIPGELPVQRVELNERGNPTFFLPVDRGILRIGPIPDPGRLDPADYHQEGRIAAVSVVFATALLLVVPLVRRIRRIDQTMAALASGDRSARAPVHGDDAVSRLAARLNALADENDRLIDAQRALLQAVAHELRTPSQRMRFRIELLDDPTIADALDRDLDELDALAQELMALLRWDHARHDARPVALAPLLHELARDLAPFAGDRTIHVPTDPPDVHAEPGGLRRALRNLLLNGLRHGATEVRVEAERRGDATVIRVIDDGDGIPTSAVEAVFEPFVRLDPSRNRDSGGVGLGLAIVRRICRAHGGTAAAEPGPGGRFVTVWPDTNGYEAGADGDTATAQSVG